MDAAITSVEAIHLLRLSLLIRYRPLHLAHCQNAGESKAKVIRKFW
jgi:hypothetical protein